MEKRKSKYVQDKNWRAYSVSFFSQGSGRVVTSCVVFEQWISAVVLSKLQTLQTTFAVVVQTTKLLLKLFYYLHADTFVSHQLFFYNYFFTCNVVDTFYFLLFTQIFISEFCLH